MWCIIICNSQTNKTLRTVNTVFVYKMDKVQFVTYQFMWKNSFVKKIYIIPGSEKWKALSQEIYKRC